jgi:hypothetical protein
VDPTTGPWQLVEQLRAWAAGVDWCVWLELGGSLGRGAGDEESDVDAGLGVSEAILYGDARNEVLNAARGFAPVADDVVQPFGVGMEHLIVQYADGRQLSLVVSPAANRKGLPPGSRALLDRNGVLQQQWNPDALTAPPGQLREWAFLAWWGLGDVAKHAARGKVWRAVASLNEARDLTLQLYAASVGVDYPVFGAVSLQNADVTLPLGLEASLPSAADPAELLRAARALATELQPLSAAHQVEGLRAVVCRRLG